MSFDIIYSDTDALLFLLILILGYVPSNFLALKILVYYTLLVKHSIGLYSIILQIYLCCQRVGLAVDTRLIRQRGGSEVNWSSQSTTTLY